MTEQKRSLLLDAEKYQHFLDDSDLTDEEKLEFMETMWNLVCEFVMLGFEIHPIQQAKSACGKHIENGSDTNVLSLDMLESINPELLNTVPKK